MTRESLISEWLDAELQLRAIDPEKVMAELARQREALQDRIKNLRKQIFVEVLPAQKSPRQQMARSTRRDLMDRIVKAMESPRAIDEVAGLVGINRNQARGCVSTLVREGVAVRLTNGNYQLIPGKGVSYGEAAAQGAVGSGPVAG